MSDIGQPERATQNRVITLFRDELGYEYLGNWQDRSNLALRGAVGVASASAEVNSNIEEWHCDRGTRTEK
jgi:hypothetical protein